MSQAKKIILIEDEQTLLDMYRHKFEHAGFTFIGYLTGESGIDGVKKEKPDLVLIDLILKSRVNGGNIDGFEVISALKKDDNTSNIPQYVLSNLNQDSDVAKAIKLGANGYFIKSDFTPAQLIEEINNILDGKEASKKVLKK